MNDNKCGFPSIDKPWLKYFPEENIGVSTPKYSIYTGFKNSATMNSSKIAISYLGKNISYKELLLKVDLCANVFVALGVKRGDIVSFLSVTFPESIIALYGLNKIGAVANFIDPRIDSHGIEKLIIDAKSKILFTIDFVYPKIKSIIPNLNLDYLVTLSPFTSASNKIKFASIFKKTNYGIPYSEKILSWKSFMSYSNLASASLVDYKENEPVSIVYTGGTTGFPKGVMLSNENFNAVALAVTHQGVDYASNDIFLDIMPIFASYGLVFGINMPLSIGIKLVIIPKFNSDKMGALIKKYRPNHVLGVPAFYEKLMNSKEVKKIDLSFLKLVCSGGDTMNEGLEAKLDIFMKEHNCNNPVAQGYGMSEMSSAATFCFNAAYKKGSVGIPTITSTIGVFKPGTTEELGYNQEGEICMTGPAVMLGYYNKPEETSKVLFKHPDGKNWVHSGDIGLIDEDGFLFIKGRIKHMVIRFDGHKVFPVQIESEIVKHSAVNSCAVIGVLDSAHLQGYVPLAIVELKKNDAGQSFDKKQIYKELVELCCKNLEERGKPADIVFIDEMPHTNLGKQNQLVLQEMYKNYSTTYKF